MADKKSVRLKWALLALLIIVALGLMSATAYFLIHKDPKVANYQDCLNTKNAKILETSPEQCVVNGQTFVNPNPAQAQKNTGTTTPPPAVLTEQDVLKNAYLTKYGYCPLYLLFSI